MMLAEKSTVQLPKYNYYNYGFAVSHDVVAILQLTEFLGNYLQDAAAAAEAFVGSASFSQVGLAYEELCRPGKRSPDDMDDGCSERWVVCAWSCRGSSANTIHRPHRGVVTNKQFICGGTRPIMRRRHRLRASSSSPVRPHLKYQSSHIDTI